MLMSLHAWQARESGDEGLDHHLRLPLFNALTHMFVRSMSRSHVCVARSLCSTE
jgi:hypothetical protein